VNSVVDSRTDGRRFAVVDLARGIAIVAMVIYHTAFDLSAERLVGFDAANDLGWKLLARATAGSFLLLVGVGLVLATRNGFRPNAFLRRLAFIVAGAALVTLGTWWFQPESFVFFGILHAIAVSSVLALPFVLWAPSWLVGIVAAGFITAPWFLTGPAFNTPALWWVGLSSDPPVTVDYVPLFPWFGVVLAGIVLGRLFLAYGTALAAWQPRNGVATTLMTAGRWSLPIYLIHQPLIIAIIMLVAPYVPPNEAVARANFMGQCETPCGTNRDAATCKAFCGCMFGGLYGTPLFEKSAFAEMSTAERTQFDGIFAACMSPASEPPAN
jgi:uncharacterized membrane protein